MGGGGLGNYLGVFELDEAEATGLALFVLECKRKDKIKLTVA